VPFKIVVMTNLISKSAGPNVAAFGMTAK